MGFKGVFIARTYFPDDCFLNKTIEGRFPVLSANYFAIVTDKINAFLQKANKICNFLRLIILIQDIVIEKKKNLISRRQCIATRFMSYIISLEYTF